MWKNTWRFLSCQHVPSWNIHQAVKQIRVHSHKSHICYAGRSRVNIVGVCQTTCESLWDCSNSTGRLIINTSGKIRGNGSSWGEEVDPPPEWTRWDPAAMTQPPNCESKAERDRVCTACSWRWFWEGGREVVVVAGGLLSNPPKKSGDLKETLKKKQLLKSYTLAGCSKVWSVQICLNKNKLPAWSKGTEGPWSRPLVVSLPAAVLHRRLKPDFITTTFLIKAWNCRPLESFWWLVCLFLSLRKNDKELSALPFKQTETELLPGVKLRGVDSMKLLWIRVGTSFEITLLCVGTWNVTEGGTALH